MVEPISMVTGGLSIAKGALELANFVKGIADSSVISAYFDWSGDRIEGSDKIEVKRHSMEGREDVWWFSVKEESDFTFVRFPVIESCLQELAGTVNGEDNPDSRYWRWIAQARQGVILGGGDPPNIKVNFMVLGYRSKALIEHFS